MGQASRVSGGKGRMGKLFTIALLLALRQSVNNFHQPGIRAA